MFPDYAIQLTGIDAIVTEMAKTLFWNFSAMTRALVSSSFGGIEGVWWISSDGQVVKNTERRSTKDLTAYLGQTADAASIRAIICLAPNSLW